MRARARAILQATVFENPWIPDHIKAGLTPRQAEFLVYEGREGLYGGAAGGGKSVALLVAALQYITEPGYHALILRRTHKQLAKADSILSKAKEWLANTGARWNGTDNRFTFPSGATLEFGHMEHDDSRFNYQGGSWAFIGTDETTQFSEVQITYPRTRQRRVAGSRIPIRWRGASNPGNVGHAYIKARYVKDVNGRDPSTPNRQFFPATIDDNPNIDREDYIRQLIESGVDPLTLAQLLRGDWDAVLGGRFKRDWFQWYRRDGDFVITDDGERFRIMDRPRFQTCDPAASDSQKADHFVVSTWCITPKANLLWLECHRAKYEIPEQVSTCQRLYRRWNPLFMAVEEVLNQRALAQLLRRSDDPVMAIRGVDPLGRDKAIRSVPAVVLASTGRVLLPEAHPTFPLDDVIGELTRFTGEDGMPDDICDTLFYAAELLPTLANPKGNRGIPTATTEQVPTASAALNAAAAAAKSGASLRPGVPTASAPPGGRPGSGRGGVPGFSMGR